MMGWTREFLTPASWLYQLGVRCRHYLYNHNWIKSEKSPLPVVSIGNLVAGGAGKTQVALLLAKQLASTCSVAILTRGYRSESEHAKHPLVVDPQKHSVKLSGDEPSLLASRLPSTFVIVNQNRLKSAYEAKKLGAHIALLDDGMQHRRLQRDVEIVVMDGQSVLTQEKFLPKGRLRECISRLKIADLIFFVGYPTQDVERMVGKLSTAPIVVAQIVPTGIFKMNGEPINSLQGKAVAVFCGIGNPKRFIKTVEDLGVRIVASHFSTDHQVMEDNALRAFATFSKQKGAEMLLCTEKDKIKFATEPSLSLPVNWIRADLEIVSNQTDWTKMVNHIKRLAGRKL